MDKKYCDICEREIIIEDARYVNLTKKDGCKVMRELEMCAHCSVALKEYLKNMKEK